MSMNTNSFHDHVIILTMAGYFRLYCHCEMMQRKREAVTSRTRHKLQSVETALSTEKVRSFMSKRIIVAYYFRLF